MTETVRMVVFVSGLVQGVGFRWWTRTHALELGLAGRARNTDDGRVEVEAEGTREACEQLLDLLTEWPSMHRRPGRVSFVSGPQWGTGRGLSGFTEA
ncbi:MAG: acylphosphatase [Tetrasphaera sp.]|jgi:acylphosphatase|nr:acylphosphatase [Tetrasphaera sp.]